MKRCLLCILILFSLLLGCTEKEGASFTMSGDETLVRVEYEVVHGMVRGEDFSIDVTPEKISSAHIFSEQELDYLSVENAAITAAQWKEINDAVLAIAPLLEGAKAAPTKKSGSSLDLIGQPLDGGDSSSFFLTWETPAGETRIHYQIPADRRFNTLADILRETADPIGREIVFYDAPVLTGLYLRQESLFPSKQYSYQCTVKTEGTDERYLFAYYYDDGSTSCNTTVYADTWSLLAEKCAELGIEKFETTSDNKTFCTLYYSDKTQRKVALDKQAQRELEDLFKQIVAAQKEDL